MRARPFLKSRYRIRSGETDGHGHWLGGEPGNGATCPTCHIPLLVLWDINARDPRFPRGRFGPLDRLPLLFCWHCVNELAYRVLPGGDVAVLPTHRGRGPDNVPYDGYPRHFARQPLALTTEIPAATREAYLKWDPDTDERGQRLTKSGHRILSDFFGHPLSSPLTLFHSQFGGLPTKHDWADDAVPCPFKRCPRRGRGMSFLAGVLSDPPGGLPMAEPSADERGWYNFFVSVEFQICGDCWTIHARNLGS